IRYVLESSKNLPIDFFIMLPSCVPATHLEAAGARFTADDLAFMMADDRIAGVAELMNYPGVFLGHESELAKIDAGRGKVIDGHAPGLRGKNLNAYALAGVRSDHESTELEEAREKLRLGLHLLVREGSTERNLEHIIALVTPQNSANCSFATDDKLPGDLVNEGHIDHSIRKAIALGVPPVTAIQMGTINTARYYRLKNQGAIAPRYWADFIVVNDLAEFKIRRVYKKGVLVAENGKYLGAASSATEQPRSTMNLNYRAPADFEVAVPRNGAAKKMRGGQVAVADGKIEASLPLPIAGLVSDQPLEIVIQKIAELKVAATRLGSALDAPFMSLSFLSLSPIPALKLTDQGLVDAVNLKLTTLIAD